MSVSGAAHSAAVALKWNMSRMKQSAVKIGCMLCVRNAEAVQAGI